MLGVVQYGGRKLNQSSFLVTCSLLVSAIWTDSLYRVLVDLFKFRSLKAIIYYYFFIYVPYSALILLVGCRKSIRPVKNCVMRCLCGYLSGARCRLFAYGPADATDATASQNPIISCLI